MLAAAPPPPAIPSTPPDASLARWTGRWRLAPQASRFRGDITRIRRAPGGYRVAVGPVTLDLRDDGAFHPTVAGRETRLTPLGGRRWRREHRINGRIVDTSILAVSADQTTLTIAGEHPGSSPEVLRRIGLGAGLAGTWRSTRLGINATPVLVLAADGPDRLRRGSQADGDFYVATMGGPPAVDQGPRSSPAASLQVRRAGASALSWVERVNGRPYRLGLDRLSPDGASLTETVRPAGEAGERQVLVYKRDG